MDAIISPPPLLFTQPSLIRKIPQNFESTGSSGWHSSMNMRAPVPYLDRELGSGKIKIYSEVPLAVTNDRCQTYWEMGVGANRRLISLRTSAISTHFPGSTSALFCLVTLVSGHVIFPITSARSQLQCEFYRYLQR